MKLYDFGLVIFVAAGLFMYTFLRPMPQQQEQQQVETKAPASIEQPIRK